MSNQVYKNLSSGTPYYGQVYLAPVIFTQNVGVVTSTATLRVSRLTNTTVLLSLEAGQVGVLWGAGSQFIQALQAIPVGFRPLYPQYFYAPLKRGATVLMCEFTFNPAGDIRIAPVDNLGAAVNLQNNDEIASSSVMYSIANA